MTTELLLLTLPLLVLTERCTLTKCRGKGPDSNRSINCLNASCGLVNETVPQCTSSTQNSDQANIISTNFKDCPHGCELSQDNSSSITCVGQVRKIGKVQMLVLVMGVSCSGLVCVACLTHWYMRRTKAVSDLVLENMNVGLIKEETEREIESEINKTEKDVILPDAINIENV